MGPRNKLLLEWRNGKSVIRTVVESAIAADAGPVVVVIGHEAAQVKTAVEDCDCRVVHNPDFASGMASSLQKGFEAGLENGADGVFVLLGDMPLAGADVILAVRQVAYENPERIVQPIAEGQPAHPVWLPARLSAGMERLSGDQGARKLIESDPEPVITIDVGGKAATDIDTVDAYETALREA
jgi:molybdenum cofactor cytidylyltransferase